MTKTRFATALLAVTAVFTAGAAVPMASAGVQSRLTASTGTVRALAECPESPNLPTARCGQITVPRDRAKPGKGTIDIGFALVPHTDTSQPGLGTIVPNPVVRARPPSTLPAARSPRPSSHCSTVVTCCSSTPVESAARPR